MWSLGEPEQPRPIARARRRREVARSTCTVMATATSCEHDEMRLLDQQQSGLGLDLRRREATPGQGDRGALAVDDALSGRVALATGPFQRDIEHAGARS